MGLYRVNFRVILGKWKLLFWALVNISFVVFERMSDLACREHVWPRAMYGGKVVIVLSFEGRTKGALNIGVLHIKQNYPALSQCPRGSTICRSPGSLKVGRVAESCKPATLSVEAFAWPGPPKIFFFIVYVQGLIFPLWHAGYWECFQTAGRGLFLYT